MSKLTPKSKRQAWFLESNDFVTIFGGAASGGKSYVGLMRFLNYVHDPSFIGYVFRKNSTDLKKEGGLFWAAVKMFKEYDKNITYTQQPMVITFPHPDPVKRKNKEKGASISFTGLDDQAGMDAIQGINISAAMVDEAAQIGEEEFWWLITRLRTDANMSPNVWLTCNPDKSSFVLTQFVHWWLYPKNTMAKKLQLDLTESDTKNLKVGDYIYVDLYKDSEFVKTIDIGSNVSYNDNVKFFSASGSISVNKKVVKDGVRLETSTVFNEDVNRAKLRFSRYSDVSNEEEFIIDYDLLITGDENVGGRPDLEKNGKTLYYLNVDNKVHLGETLDELYELLPDFKDHPTIEPKTVRFIGATCKDNPTYLLKNPQYESTLQNQPRLKKEQLYFGNWYVSEEGAGYFKRDWVEPLITKAINEEDVVQRIRAFDLASSVPTESNPYPDYTAGVLIAKTRYNEYIVEHVVRFRERSGDVEKRIVEIVREDKALYGMKYKAYLPQDPAGAGLIARQHYSGVFANHKLAIYFFKVGSSNGKLASFEPFSSCALNGLVRVVEADWNDAYFDELEIFDGLRSTSTKKDD